MPKMTKIEEFCQLYNKRWGVTRRKRLRCASDTGTLDVLGIFLLPAFLLPTIGFQQAGRNRCPSRDADQRYDR